MLVSFPISKLRKQNTYALRSKNTWSRSPLYRDKLMSNCISLKFKENLAIPERICLSRGGLIDPWSFSLATPLNALPRNLRSPWAFFLRREIRERCRMGLPCSRSKSFWPLHFIWASSISGHQANDLFSNDRLCVEFRTREFSMDGNMLNDWK